MPPEFKSFNDNINQGMIQDIAPRTFSNAYKTKRPETTSYALYFNGHSVLVGKDSPTLRFPRFEELTNAREEIYQEAIYLFAIDDECFYLVNHLPEEQPEFEMKDTGIFRTSNPRHLAFAGITAYSLYKWYDNHRYCSHCGNRLVHHDKERMLYCEKCNNTEYPKIMPAVIIAVTNGNKILLSKYANREYTRYALLAGFTEIGESIEETVKREVMEEVGLHVKNLRYYKSQPWSFSDTLLMGFFAEVEGDDSITLDREELALAEWFERENIPVSESDISLTSEMIEYFRNHQE